MKGKRSFVGRKWVGALVFLLLLSILSPFSFVSAGEQAKRGAELPRIDPSINTQSKEKIRVLVEFTTDPAVVQQVRDRKGRAAAEASVRSAAEEFRTQLEERKISGTITSEFRTVFSGVGLEIPADQVPKLRKIAGIRAVYANRRVEPVPAVRSRTPSYGEDSMSFIGADEFWKQGYEGEGIRVGVLDTGIDYNHPDLKKAYKGGYDFVDNDDDPYEGGKGIDTNHGTHVAGIIAGRGDPRKGGVRGVAPRADLYVYRVLGPQGGWDEWVIAGIERAVRDGMDVINLSLGSPVNHSDTPASRAVNNAVMAGTVVVAAAGNEGNFGLKTVGTPAAADLAITVGASTFPSKSYKFTARAGVTGDREYTLLWMSEEDPGDLKSLFKGKPLAYVGLGRPEDFAGKNLRNKILLIKRGGALFEELRERAEAAGAAGVILFNFDGWNEHILRPVPVPGGFPMFDMRGDEGRELAEALDGASKKVADLRLLERLEESSPGDELADFSSKGPVMNNLHIKPDLVAPGVGIRSTVPAFGGSYKKAYAGLSGTSMAAPHVAGMAALFRKSRPSFDPFDIKAALMNTSVEMKPKDPDGERYRAFEVGAGRVDGSALLHTPVTAQVHAVAEYTRDPFSDRDPKPVAHRTGTVHFGEIGTGEGEEPQRITLKNRSGKKRVYRASYDIHRYLPLGEAPEVKEASGISLAFDRQEITVPAGGEVDWTVRLSVGDEVPEGYYEGRIRLTPADPAMPELRIPFIVYNNAKLVEGVSSITSNPRSLSLNGDGVHDKTEVEYELTMDMVSADVFLHDPEGQNLGLIRTLTGEELKEGRHAFTWDGMYRDPDDGAVKKPETGFYRLAMVGVDRLNNRHERWQMIIVANEPTRIEVDGDRLTTEVNRVTGSLSSPLMDLLWGRYFGDPYFSGFFNLGYEVFVGDEKHSEGWAKLEMIPGKPENKFFEIADALPPGESRLVLRYSDKAGNTTRVELPVTYDVDTSITGREVELGEELKLTLSAHQVKDLMSGELKLEYLSDVFTLERVELTEAFRRLAPETTKVSHRVGDRWTDEKGREHRSVRIRASLGEDAPKGAAGNVSVVNVYFTVSKDARFLGVHPFRITDARYDDGSRTEKKLRGSSRDIEVYTPPATLSGRVKPEAYLDKKGEPRSDILYKIPGYILEVMDAETGQPLLPEDGYRTQLTTALLEDGRFLIQGLKPGKTYDVRLVYPGHFTGVAKGVRTSAKDSRGFEIPLSEVKVDLGLQLAGDADGNDVIDEEDVSLIRRFLGEKAVDGNYAHYLAQKADIYYDGVIDEKDLNFALKNLGKRNEK